MLLGSQIINDALRIVSAYSSLLVLLSRLTIDSIPNHSRLISNYQFLFYLISSFYIRRSQKPNLYITELLSRFWSRTLNNCRLESMSLECRHQWEIVRQIDCVGRCYLRVIIVICDTGTHKSTSGKQFLVSDFSFSF